jgi:hypothetical protein
MLKIKTTILCLCLTVFVLPQVSADQKSITLKDGSVIRGELVSFENGLYTVKTDNLGQLILSEANVVSVVNTALAGTVPQPQVAQAQAPMQQGDFSNQVANMQSQIMANPQTMQSIMAMAEDPEIAAMFSDPAFVQQLTAAMSGGNPEALASDPRIQKLMANPKMQALIQQIQPGTTVPNQ